jgi:molybdopterin/thiamine biosynthesis adenylyltransferase
VPSCSQAGVLGVLAGIMGTIQATEALKHVLDIGDLLTDRLLVFNALKMRFREAAFKRNPACRLCGSTPTITTLRDEIPDADVYAPRKNDGVT